jgi:tRNA(fMet)-specific endonuclease VapC
MLDTNVLSELIRNPKGPVGERIARVEPGTVCTSVVVAGELRFGARRRGSDALTRRVDDLLEVLPVLPFDVPADRHYADIRVALERVGTPIGSHDLLIGAHARSRQLTLVTHNVRELARVPGLAVEDWQGA